MLGSDTDSIGDAEVPTAMPISPAGGDSNLLDSVLLAEWEDRADQGLFRYDVTACPTKLVPGPYGFIAQCNEGRLSKKRPTEFRVDQVCHNSRTAFSLCNICPPLVHVQPRVIHSLAAAGM